MAATYEPIASTTLASSAASITFSGITADWTDLVCVIQGVAAGGSALSVRLNGDTGSNYSWTGLQGTGSAANSTRQSNHNWARVGSFTTGGPHMARFHIMSYANTNVYKTILSAGERHGTELWRIVGLWRNASAVTSVQVGLEASTLSSGAIAALYGIQAA